MKWYTQEKITQAINQMIQNWRRYNTLLETKGSEKARQEWKKDFCPLCQIFNSQVCYYPCCKGETPCPVVATYGINCHEQEAQSGPLIKNIPETLELAEGLEGYTIGRDDIEEEEEDN